MNAMLNITALRYKTLCKNVHYKAPLAKPANLSCRKLHDRKKNLTFSCPLDCGTSVHLHTHTYTQNIYAKTFNTHCSKFFSDNLK